MATSRALLLRAIHSTGRAAVWLLDPRALIRLAGRHALALVLLYSAYGSYGAIRTAAKRLLLLLGRLIGNKTTERMRRLHRVMATSDSFEEWNAAAKELDRVRGLERWQADPESNLYDYRRIQENEAALRALLDEERPRELMRFLRSRLLRNIGGIGDQELHTCCKSGTKTAIERYLDAVLAALRYISDTEFADISAAEKLAFFSETRHAFGRSALMLSGGSTFGLYHAGVINALHETDMLPRVVSGSSVGSIFAGIIGTRTDAELKQLRQVETFDLSFFPSSRGSILRKLKRLVSHGVLMDISILARCVRSNIGDYTFAEAYAKTGRVINIVVAPAEGAQENARLLNYLTSPNVLVWSAACASCAIPGVYEPVELLAKDADGSIVKLYKERVLFADGSFCMDLPMHRLSELFNVNHSIVSQVNPHVLPFVLPKSRRHRRPRVLHHIMQFLSLELKNLALGWYEICVDVLPFARIMRNLVRQVYSGDVTLYPIVGYSEFLLILTNPTHERLRRCMDAARRYTYRHVELLQNHCCIEYALDDAVRQTRASMLLHGDLPLDAREVNGSRIQSWSAEQFEAVQAAARQSHSASFEYRPKRPLDFMYD